MAELKWVDNPRTRRETANGEQGIWTVSYEGKLWYTPNGEDTPDRYLGNFGSIVTARNEAERLEADKKKRREEKEKKGERLNWTATLTGFEALGERGMWYAEFDRWGKLEVEKPWSLLLKKTGAATRIVIGHYVDFKTAKGVAAELDAEPEEVPEPPSGNVHARLFAMQFLAGIEASDDPDDVDSFESDARVSTIATALEKAGVAEHLIEKLGAGSFGTAWALDDGRVAKLTADATEVKAAYFLSQRKPLPHVVEFHAAWFLEGVTTFAASGWDPASEEAVRKHVPVGLTVMQRLEPADFLSRKRLSRSVHLYKEANDLSWHNLVGLSHAKQREKLRTGSEGMAAMLREAAAHNADFAQLYDNVADALDELRDIGLYAIDAHGGNVGFDDEASVYKLFDIGVSSVPGKQQPPKLGEDVTGTFETQPQVPTLRVEGRMSGMLTWSRSAGGTGWRAEGADGSVWLLRQRPHGRWALHHDGREYGPFPDLEAGKRDAEHRNKLTINEPSGAAAFAEQLLSSGLEEYVAVDGNGKLVAGPFESYGDAKRHADLAGGYVRFLAEQAREAAQDFVSIEAAVEHEKRQGGAVGQREIGDGVYVLYPNEMGKRVYYKSGKYHVAARAEYLGVRSAAEKAAAPGYAGVPTPIFTGRYKKKRIAVRYWPTDHDNGLPYLAQVEDDPSFAGRWRTEKEAVEGLKKEIDARASAKPTKAKEDFNVAKRDVKAVRAGRAVGQLRNSRAIYEHVHPTLVKYSQEVVLVIPLDLRGRPLAKKPFIVAMGQKAEVSVEVDDVIRPAIKSNCSGFIVVHNHPSGEALPSEADRDLTARIRQKAPDKTPLIDHVVCGDGKFYSFADEKLYEVR